MAELLIYISTTECRANLLKTWFPKFMGVNKFNLQIYAKTFQFLHNNRHMNINEKFMMLNYRILTN